MDKKDTLKAYNFYIKPPVRAHMPGEKQWNADASPKCKCEWHNYPSAVGRGDTPQEALQNAIDVIYEKFNGKVN